MPHLNAVEVDPDAHRDLFAAGVSEQPGIASVDGLVRRRPQAEPALVALLPRSGNVPGLDAVRIDGTVLGFSAFLILLTGIGFGLIPALQATAMETS